MAGNAVQRGQARPQLMGDNQTTPTIGAGAIPTIQYSQGMGKALQQFSRDLFTVSKGIERRLDDRAEAEGAVAGAAAGAAGNVELQDYGTIRGRAYNQAAISTFVTTMETRQIAKLQALQSQYGSDPATLEREFNHYTEGTAKELDRIDPAAGAGYRQRAFVRSQSAIEAAKDTAFKLTRDQADAALIENEMMIDAEIKASAADLFSANPERSKAAAQLLGQAQADYMQVYNAVDPATGRPLYSAKERAAAQADLRVKVLENAALSWFAGNEDKAAAYIKFVNGELPIGMNAKADVKFIDQTGGKTRNLPVKDGVRDMIATAVTATDPRLAVKVISGGQVSIAEAKAMGARKVGNKWILPNGKAIRVGSERHDHGGSADLILSLNGRDIRPGDDPALYERFFENAAAAGLTGLGHYDWGVHVGMGSRAGWGPDTSGATLDPRFKAAMERGWNGERLESAPQSQVRNLRELLPDDVIGRMESEMRAQISFENQMKDRAEAQDEKTLKAMQEASGYELTNRLYSAGDVDPNTQQVIQPLTRGEVTEAVRLGVIPASHGQQLIKALTVEKPDVSDRDTYDDILRRMYAGEDVYQMVIANTDRLSSSDASALLSKNQTLNVDNAGALSKEQQFHYSALEDLLEPDGFMAQLDEGAERRKFFALDEYRQRVLEGENPRDVARDLSERATRDANDMTQTALDRMVRPRFAVTDPGGLGIIDVAKSAASLKQAYDQKLISEASYRRQVSLLRQWDQVQKQIGQK